MDALRKSNSTSLMDHLRLPNSIWEKERASYRSVSVTSLSREDGLAWHVKCFPNSVPDSRTTVLFHCTSVTHAALIHCYPGTGSQGPSSSSHFGKLFSFGVYGNKGLQTFSSIREIDLITCLKRSPRKVIFQHLCNIKFYQPRLYNSSNTAILSRAYSKHTL